MQLGEILLVKQIITAGELESALKIQQQTGGRLGDIIAANGFTNYLEIYRAVAEHYGLEFINLLESPPDKSLLNANDAKEYISRLFIPYKQDTEEKIIITIAELSAENKEFIEKKYGKNIKFAITSPNDIRKIVEKEFGKNFEVESRLALWNSNPELSARYIFSPRVQTIFYGFLAFCAIYLSISPEQFAEIFAYFCGVIYLASMLAKLFIFCASFFIRRKESYSTIPDTELPIYSIIVPMYKEKESVAKLIRHLNKLDYPKEKLDIKLVLEEGDSETLAEIKKQKPSGNFEIIRVPPSSLRTKPRACNYALSFVRGEFVTIFDADDEPEATHLKKAVYAFRNSPTNVACLQGRLAYYNSHDNLLTRCFSLEYNMLFNHLLYGLERLQIPIPLGGTSNHISVQKLKELGAWYAFNVTEDADLGVRIAALGLKTQMLDADTFEEAPNLLGVWLRQRSRWIKGYMQTYIVHMRHPVKLYKTIGARAFFGFQFFIGISSFSFITAPIMWAISLYWLANLGDTPLPYPLVAICNINLAVNFLSHWLMLAFCLKNERKIDAETIIALLLYPLYLLLHSIASYKALYQLIAKPHFWEKTTHGLAKFRIAG